MSDSNLLTFLALVFITVLLLSEIIMVPTFGSNARDSKQLRKRLLELEQLSRTQAVSLVREKRMRQLLPIERRLESLACMPPIQRLIEQAGYAFPAYRLVALSLGLASTAGLLSLLFLDGVMMPVLAAMAAGMLPTFKLRRDRRKRLELFEEHLPEALDLMARALKAGTPFSGAMSYVSKEMEGPVAEEFGLTFDEINYGRDVTQAFNLLILRMPSLSLIAVTTSIIIQRETGGNLAEVLDKISKLLRARFRFQRQVRTMTAEGRLSAWVLALIPMFLFFIMYRMQPEVYENFLQTDIGVRLIQVGLGLMLAGMIWISRLINIEV